jgi:hypothetical protein
MDLTQIRRGSAYDLVTPDGTVGVMSSGQGSVSNNTGGSGRCIEQARRH